MQDLFNKKKNARLCEACGLDLPFKMSNKLKDSTNDGQYLCKTCARVCITLLFLLIVLIQVDYYK